MFNSPRGQRSLGLSANDFGSSYVDEGPLGSTVYDSLDPWSNAPSPSPPSVPTAPTIFRNVIADATVPSIYNDAYAAIDPTNIGETSVNALYRVLGTSSLPAATIDKIVSLVSSRPRVSKLEFFVALSLVALAQSGKDVSIEQVAALSSQNTLPEPRLTLDALPPSTSTLNYAPNAQSRSSNPAVLAPVAMYPPDDPWGTPRLSTSFDPSRGFTNVGPSSALAGSGLPSEWWNKQEDVKVSILGQQGFILNRYTVYEVVTDRGTPVTRRYSEFVFLWDCLIRRYPFRLLPVLPPKRIGPDEQFLELRRRGLTRYLRFVINHPILKEDALLGVFLTVPSFEAWRKTSSISLEEESLSKRLDRVEEMSIPSDLEEKLLIVRRKINPLIEHWQRICALCDRIVKRCEAAAVWIPPDLQRTHQPTHFAFAPFSSSASINSDDSNTSSLFSLFSINFFNRDDEQADLSRLTNVMKSLAELNDQCWRGEHCDLCGGVREGIERVAVYTQRHCDLSEQRCHALLYSTLETLKSQRDLYIAMRDLLVRIDRLSVDQVERLRKRIDATSLKLEGVKQAKKDKWEEEAERLVSQIERDQATIASQLNRRVFIRACKWHELRVVLHNRENTLLTLALQAFARDEQQSSEQIAANWSSLVNAVERMPLE